MPDNLKGRPGPGQPVGSKTRHKIMTTAELINILDELGHNPISEQIALYKDAATPPHVKQRINEVFMKFIFPQLKTVDHSGMIEHNHLQFGWQASDPAPEALTVDATITP